MEKGIIIKSTGSFYTVKCENNLIIKCRIKGKFRIKGIRTTNPIAVGDIVDIEHVDKDNIGVIKNIHKRKNYIIRKSINQSRRGHIIAANIDQAILMVSLMYPTTPLKFIDRFLVTTEFYKITAKIIFNKIDLYDEETLKKLEELKSVYEKIGYKCYETSAKEKININQITELLKNKISVISGNSGVGKSTLVNTIDSKLDLKTSEISDYHKKGKHTTTFYEMFDLDFGGSVIDTPGIKGFGVVDIKKEDISHNFPEMFRLLDNCRFYNCTHTHEPDCAVKDAVNNGDISLSRYISYVSIIENEDEDEKYRDDIFK